MMVAMGRQIRSRPSASGLVEPALREYAQALGIPIHVYAPANRLSRPQRGGGLHLHIFALPARPHRVALWPVTPSVELPVVLSWALAAGTTHALAPGNLFSQGVVKSDQTGRAIAGILGENIYVLFDLLRQPEAVIPVMMRRTLDLCLEGSTELLSQRTGRLPHQVQVILHRLSHATTLLALDLSAAADQDLETADGPSPGARPVEDGDFIQKQMAMVEGRLKELSRQMAMQTRLLGSCGERIRILKEMEQSEEAPAREIEALIDIPEVRDIEVLGDRLCLFTDTIDTVVGGKRYRLGRFRVDIRFNGEVTIKNLTRPYGYYDHPHVWNGRPCLGNIHQSVLKLVSEFQWVAAAELLLEYLKSVNPKGWYTPVSHWEELPA